MQETVERTTYAGVTRVNGAFDRAYQQLKSLVLLGNLPPGIQINIRGMADRLRVSPTPVREALIRLAVEELVTLEANKGFFTKPLSSEELRADCELAFLILSYGITRSSENPKASPFSNPAVESRLRTARGRECAAVLESIYEHIAALTNNQKAAKAIRKFNDRTMFVRGIDLEADDRALSVADSVEQISNCLRRKCSDEAQGCFQQHFETFVEKLPILAKEGNARSIMGLQA